MFELESSLNAQQSASLTPALLQGLHILALSETQIDQLISDEISDGLPLENDFQGERRIASFSEFDEEMAASDTLIERLRAQLYEGDFNCIEKVIGEHLLGEINDDGFLDDKKEGLERISMSLEWPFNWIESVRKRMLRFEPVGCFALSLEECLLAQWRAREERDSVLERVLSNEWLHASASKPQKTAQNLGCSEKRLRDALHKLRTLSARPALGHHNHLPVQVIKPEITVKVCDDSVRAYSLQDRSFCLQQGTPDLARWQAAKRLVENLKRREQTLMRVAQTILDHQRPWFLKKAPLLPLTLKDVACSLQIHESTVSRAVSGKYLSCERGIYELRSFFATRIAHADQDALSSDAVKNAISELMKSENAKKPLSDLAIKERLSAAHIFVARRTVAKYRAQLKIRPANQRRTL